MVLLQMFLVDMLFFYTLYILLSLNLQRIQSLFIEKLYNTHYVEPASFLHLLMSECIGANKLQLIKMTIDHFIDNCTASPVETG